MRTLYKRFTINSVELGSYKFIWVEWTTTIYILQHLNNDDGLLSWINEYNHTRQTRPYKLSIGWRSWALHTGQSKPQIFSTLSIGTLLANLLKIFVAKSLVASKCSGEMFYKYRRHLISKLRSSLTEPSNRCLRKSRFLKMLTMEWIKKQVQSVFNYLIKHS